MALREDLTAAALVQEALTADGYRTSIDRIGPRLAAARALRSAGDSMAADAVDSELLHELESDPGKFSSTEQAMLVDLVQRRRGTLAALELAGRNPLPGSRLSAQIGVLEVARIGGAEQLEHGTLVLLAPDAKEQRNPQCLARLANLFLVKGDGQRSDELALLAEQSAVLSSDLYASGDVLATLVRGRLAVGDVGGAKRLALEYARKRGGTGFADADVGFQLVSILRAGIEEGALEDVRDVPQWISDASSRSEAHALLAVAEAEQGRGDTAEQQWAGAREAAEEAATPGMSALAITLHEAGLTPEAERTLAEAYEALPRAADPGQHAAWRRALGQAEAALGRVDAALAIAAELPREPAWMQNMRDELFAQLAFELWRRGEAARVLPTLDRISTPEARVTAIRDRAAQFGAFERPERERAELVAGFVERARQVRLELLAGALDAIAGSGLATARDPAALHSWSLPPCVPGHWTTPSREDAARYAEALRTRLAEAGIPGPPVRAVRERRLRCYTAGRVVELDGVFEGLPYVYALLVVGDRTIRIGGEGSAWNALNAQTPPTFAEDDDWIEYVRLFATQIGDSGGRFRVVADADELTELVRANAALPVLAVAPPRVIERRDDATSVECAFVLKGQLRTGRFEITPTGGVTLHDDRLLADDLPLDRESYQERAGGFLRLDDGLANALGRVGGERGAGAYDIGLAYATGFGRGGWLIDETRAGTWLGDAQYNGRAHAFRDVGMALLRGEGVPANAAASWVWFRSAAASGDLDSGVTLARLLLATRSPQLAEEALRQLRAGERAGHAASTFELAVATTNGTASSSADLVLGHRLFASAAERGSGAAAQQLGLFLADPADPAGRDPMLAARWFERAAELGTPTALYFLGILRANGLGPVELGEPEDLYRRAAESGVLAAHVVLALRARKRGPSAPLASRADALEHARIASEAGHRHGALALALLHLDGGDLPAARAAHERALTLELPAPTLRSFVDPCYLQGAPAGVAIDAARALDSWRMAAEAELARRVGGR